MKNLVLSLVLLMFSVVIGCTSSTNEIIQTKKGLQFLKDSSIVISDSIFTGGIEGPAVNSKGSLFLVNLNQEGTIGTKAFDSDSFSLFVTLPKGSVGNGIRFDQSDNMYIADYPKHNVLRIEAGTKHVEIYAHDSTMNQPNDLAIMKNGILFASDPNWGASSGKLWKITNTRDIVLLEDSMGTTNGVEVSPNQKVLYVNESIQRKIWKYDLNESGEISNKQLFKEFEDGGMDGMRCDEKGNLYVARYGKGVVAILTPEGDVLREVKLNGMKPTNVAFGGPNRDVVFVTIQDRKWVEAFQAEAPGKN